MHFFLLIVKIKAWKMSNYLRVHLSNVRLNYVSITLSFSILLPAMTVSFFDISPIYKVDDLLSAWYPIKIAIVRDLLYE